MGPLCSTLLLIKFDASASVPEDDDDCGMKWITVEPTTRTAAWSVDITPAIMDGASGTASNPVVTSTGEVEAAAASTARMFSIEGTIDG